MPKFSFLACLEMVKKFLGVGCRGGGWGVVGWGVVWCGVVVEAHFSVQLKPRPS